MYQIDDDNKNDIPNISILLNLTCQIFGENKWDSEKEKKKSK